MASYKERKAEQEKWESFADKLGVDLLDIRDRTSVAVLGTNKDEGQLAPWLRNRILERMEWKPKAGVASIRSCTDG